MLKENLDKNLGTETPNKDNEKRLLNSKRGGGIELDHEVKMK